MDLRSLHIFIQVAELNSFTRAGEKLGYSQPTISFQIKQLEQELGVALFDRIGHTVSLTDPGRDVLAYAQRIVNLWQEMEMDASGQREVGGMVRLGMADSLCGPLIVREFSRFRREYPKAVLHVTAAGTGELFRLLDRNEVDLLCTLDDHIYNTNYVIAHEEKVGVNFVVSAQNPLAVRKAVAVEELVTESFLLTEKDMSYRRMLDENLARRSLEIQPVLEISRADLICQLVAEDMGISFLPDYVTEVAVQAGEVVRLQVEDFQVELWKQLLYRRDKWVSAQMQAVIGHLSRLSL